MKRFLFVILVLIIVFLGWYYLKHPLVAKVKIRNTVFTVDVAATEPQKQLGLGGRVSMPTDHGMLFPYDHKEQYEYWMKGMQFALDFIWIDGKTVADITPNIPFPEAGETPRIVRPNVPVDKVLEVHAGTIERVGIKIGDSVEFIDR